MKNTAFLFCFGISLLGFGRGSVAQEVELRPKEPISIRAPENSDWKVTTKFKGIQERLPDGSTAPVSSVRTVRKRGKLVHDRVSYGSVTYENFIVGPMILTDYGKPGHVTGVSADGRRFFPTDVTDFDRLRWLGMKYFEKVDEHEGRKVFVFRISGDAKPLSSVQQSELAAAGKEGRKPSFVSDSVAMIDVQTQLPVYYEDDEVTETYEFLPKTTAPIVIPDVVKDELSYRLRHAARSAANTAPGRKTGN